MNFPRIRNFDFVIDRTYIIPGVFAGKAWAISEDIYGNQKYYRPLCAANNISFVYGSRVGLRPIIQAYRNELAQDGLTENQITEKINEYYYNNTPSDYDWTSYEDLISGYVSDLFLGRLLIVPSVESAVEWLRRYDTVSLG